MFFILGFNSFMLEIWNFILKFPSESPTPTSTPTNWKFNIILFSLSWRLLNLNFVVFPMPLSFAKKHIIIRTHEAKKNPIETTQMSLGIVPRLLRRGKLNLPT